MPGFTPRPLEILKNAGIPRNNYLQRLSQTCRLVHISADKKILKKLWPRDKNPLFRYAQHLICKIHKTLFLPLLHVMRQRRHKKASALLQFLREIFPLETELFPSVSDPSLKTDLDHGF